MGGDNLGQEAILNRKRKNCGIASLLVGMVAMAILPGKGISQNRSVEETLAALEKGPTLGSATAQVSMVEFSDFQCSFCKRFWADTLPRLKETYIKKGQVRFVYRHSAILGKQSVQAAQGADCAGEQGKFWQYHDRLFENQGGLSFTNAKLKQYAQELGLKTSSFSPCLDSDKYVKKVEGETAGAGFVGVRGTPTFFVNGRRLVGAQPFEIFQKVIEEQLKKIGSEKKEK
jgi:protein-disulfide isomerase